MNNSADRIRILTARYLVVIVVVTVFLRVGQGTASDGKIQIEIAGLLGEKAVLIINGRQQILQIGAVTAEGIKLIAVEPDGVTLEIDGTSNYYALGSNQVGTKFSKPEQISEQVFRDGSGMFRTVGSINGYPVNFLIDTGANTVAMNSAQAKRMGIQYLLQGQATIVSTASGNTTAYAVRLKDVSVGQIKLSNIAAMVIDGAYPEDILLGMSFLGRLNVKNENEVMMLESRF